MKRVDMILQGKGGVGKSFIATLLAQHYKDQGVETVCIDTDPVNATFFSYEGLGVQRLELLENRKINPRGFDGLIGKIMEAPGESVVVVDNGAATFVPLCSYLVEHDVLSVLRQPGCQVRFHTVVTGGQGINETVGGLGSLCGYFPDVLVVLWKNEFFGPLKSLNGMKFEDFDVVQEHKDQLVAQIVLPEVEGETTGEDLNKMFLHRMSFEEAIDSEEFFIMGRQRLLMYWREVNGRMKSAGLLKLDDPFGKAALPPQDGGPSPDGEDKSMAGKEEEGPAP